MSIASVLPESLSFLGQQFLDFVCHPYWLVSSLSTRRGYGYVLTFKSPDRISKIAPARVDVFIQQ